MAVGMQSPIPDYGNFGQNIADSFTRSYNSANERALKLKLHGDELGERQRQFDTTLSFNKGVALGQLDGIPTLEGKKFKMMEDEFNFLKMERDQNTEIMQHKNRLKQQKDDLYRDYKQFQKGRDTNWYDYIDIFGIGEDSYWHPEDISFDEWLDRTGQSLPDYEGFDTSDLTGRSIGTFRSQQPWEGSQGDDSQVLFDMLSGLGLNQTGSGLMQLPSNNTGGY